MATFVEGMVRGWLIELALSSRIRECYITHYPGDGLPIFSGRRSFTRISCPTLLHNLPELVDLRQSVMIVDHWDLAVYDLHDDLSL